MSCLQHRLQKKDFDCLPQELRDKMNDLIDLGQAFEEYVR